MQCRYSVLGTFAYAYVGENVRRCTIRTDEGVVKPPGEGADLHAYHIMQLVHCNLRHEVATCKAGRRQRAKRLRSRGSTGRERTVTRLGNGLGWLG